MQLRIAHISFIRLDTVLGHRLFSHFYEPTCLHASSSSSSFGLHSQQPHSQQLLGCSPSNFRVAPNLRLSGRCCATLGSQCRASIMVAIGMCDTRRRGRRSRSPMWKVGRWSSGRSPSPTSTPHAKVFSSGLRLWRSATVGGSSGCRPGTTRCQTLKCARSSGSSFRTAEGKETTPCLPDLFVPNLFT